MSHHKRVAVIGECMIEVRGAPFGMLHQTYGGDTLNTAVYLKRLSRGMADIHFVTAVGRDVLSDGMIQQWETEGLKTDSVLRDPRRLPGMYFIQLDERGERTFLYWRGESAARHLLKHPDFEDVAIRLEAMNLIYMSGITLAILPPDDRAMLIALLSRLAARGIPIAFDTNYRSSLWPSVEAARAAIRALLPATWILLLTHEDEHSLWGDETATATLQRLESQDIPIVVVKTGSAGCMLRHAGDIVTVRAEPITDVIDTTAAGDAFNAGFLAGWLSGLKPEQSCAFGNRLAGRVIRYPGAIIPTDAMPSSEDLLGD